MVLINNVEWVTYNTININETKNSAAAVLGQNIENFDKELHRNRKRRYSRLSREISVEKYVGLMWGV